MAGSAEQPIRVLIVCTGNICRSPQAERLFQAAVSRYGGEGVVEVTSAGTAALVGHPFEDHAAELTEAYGASASNHSARQLTPDLVADADLVLGMERIHRAQIVRLLPRASRYTFTLREFARLVATASLDGSGPGGSWPDPVAAMRDRIGVIAASRGMGIPVAQGLDDIEDPYRRSEQTHRRTAAQIAEAVETAATWLVAGSARPAE